MTPETKLCPKCGESFVCNNHDIMKCACIGIPLTNKALQEISEQYSNCLCRNCLMEYAGKYECISGISD